MARTKAGRFIAVDGESVTFPGGEHRYVLLTAYCWNGNSHVIRDDNGLSTQRCFDFLIGLENRYKAILVGFSWGYDLNMQLRDVSRRNMLEFARRDRMFVHLGEWTYGVHAIPGKMTKITRGTIDAQGKKLLRDTIKRCTVYDVFGFFQCSFVKALQTWEITQDTGFIERMKDARSTFSLADIDEMSEYNLQECQLLVQLVNKVVAAFRSVDIILESYHGAGAAGNAILRKYGVRHHVERHPDEVNDPIMRAYFGGRVQCIRQGSLDGPVYQCDINSAYPAAMCELPSLVDGQWSSTYQYERGQVGLYHVRWSLHRDSPICPFPYRHKGLVYYPPMGEGWYWHYEVEAAIEYFGSELQILEGVTFRAATTVKPFAFVPAEYAKRRAYKDAGREEHIAIKLALNSMYGKQAQAIGYGGKKPPYQSFVWAGLTTSWTRAQMYRLAMRNPASVITIATDGILSTEILSNDESTALGGLELSRYDHAFVFGAGRYLLSKGKETTYKTRGFGSKELDWRRMYEAWLQDGILAQIPVYPKRFVGYKAARHLDRWQDWRTWVTMPKVLQPAQFTRATIVKEPGRPRFGGELTVRWRGIRPEGSTMSEPFTPKQDPYIDEDILLEQPL